MRVVNNLGLAPKIPAWAVASRAGSSAATALYGGAHRGRPVVLS